MMSGVNVAVSGGIASQLCSIQLEQSKLKSIDQKSSLFYIIVFGINGI